jgi:hypothetical protein
MSSPNRSTRPAVAPAPRTAALLRLMRRDGGTLAGTRQVLWRQYARADVPSPIFRNRKKIFFPFLKTRHVVQHGRSRRADGPRQRGGRLGAAAMGPRRAATAVARARLHAPSPRRPTRDGRMGKPLPAGLAACARMLHFSRVSELVRSPDRRVRGEATEASSAPCSGCAMWGLLMGRMAGRPGNRRKSAILGGCYNRRFHRRG